jgi:hypothetical protein
MIFPDCRKDETYNSDFLTGNNKSFIEGFDYTIKTAENLANNLDVYEDDLGDKFSIISKNFSLFLDILKDWCEMERNQLVTSMLDEMSDEEFEEARKKAMAENPDKEYVDTRSFQHLAKNSEE